jgi:ADP-ribosylglycohydrolase
MSTTVVCLKGQKNQELEKDQVYIGRKFSMGGWQLEESPYMNRFKGRNAVANYYIWIMKDEQEKLRKKIKKNLTGKKLACWCKDTHKNDEIPCHGDVLVYICDDEMNDTLEKAIDEEQELYNKVSSFRKKFKLLVESIEPLSYQDRIIGAFTCVFMGDTIGSLYEFGKDHPEFSNKIINRLEVKGNRFNPDDNYTYGLAQPTDDSEMFLTLIGHMIDQFKLNNKKNFSNLIDAEKLAILYMEWCNSGTAAVGKNTKELFGGIKTLKGFKNHYEKKFGFEPSYNEKEQMESDSAENQLSNGSLMRCYALALLPDNSINYKDIYLSNPSSIVEQIENDYITALRMAIQGESVEDIYSYLIRKDKKRNEKYQEVIDDIKNEVKRTLTNKKSKGEFIEGKASIFSAFYSVLWCLFYYINGYKITDKKKKKKEVNIFDLYRSLIEDFPGSDTDTNCAIMGGLMGAIIGYSKLCEDDDFNYNFKLIHKISEETDRPRPYEYHPSRMFELYPKIFELYEKYNL